MKKILRPEECVVKYLSSSVMEKLDQFVAGASNLLRPKSCLIYSIPV